MASVDISPDASARRLTLTWIGHDCRMLIRQEVPADVRAIDCVLAVAFPPPGPGVEPVEVALVQGLRGDAGWIPSLSLVAEDDAGLIIGHVVCTVGAVEDDKVLGLGPIGGADPVWLTP